MTSFGRGRGWSSQNYNKEQSLRRPGIATFGNNAVKDIIDKITTYDIYEYATISPQLIQEITDLLTSAVNKDNLKYYNNREQRFLMRSEAKVISFYVLTQNYKFQGYMRKSLEASSNLWLTYHKSSNDIQR